MLSPELLGSIYLCTFSKQLFHAVFISVFLFFLDLFMLCIEMFSLVWRNPQLKKENQKILLYEADTIKKMFYKNNLQVLQRIFPGNCLIEVTKILFYQIS